jgi:hypothetical protein
MYFSILLLRVSLTKFNCLKDLKHCNKYNIRNRRSEIREDLAKFIQKITIHDILSLRLALSNIYVVSLRDDELSRAAIVSIWAISKR